MKIKLLWLLLCIHISTYSQNFIDTVCIEKIYSTNENNDYDATITTYDSYANYVNDENIIAERWTIGGNPYTFRALMKYNLPILPNNSIILKSELYLYYNNFTTHLQGNSFYSGSPYPLQNNGYIFRITQNWYPNTVTWNNQPSYNSSIYDIVPVSNSQNQDLVVDITNITKESYLNPNTSFGFMFAMADESSYYRCQVYASSNLNDITKHPKIKICYASAPNSVLSENKLYNNFYTIDNILFNFNKTKIDFIEIINLNSQIVYHQEINNSNEKNTIQHNLIPGLYIVKVVANHQQYFFKHIFN